VSSRRRAAAWRAVISAPRAAAAAGAPCGGSGCDREPGHGDPREVQAQRGVSAGAGEMAGVAAVGSQLMPRRPFQRVPRRRSLPCRRPPGEAVGQRRSQLFQPDQRAARAAGGHVPMLVAGAMEDCPRHHLRRVIRCRQARFRGEMVARVPRQRRVDRRRLDQVHHHRQFSLRHLHPQRVGERFDRMLAGGIAALRHGRPARQDAADVDERPAALGEQRQRHLRAVDDAPEVDVEQAVLVFKRHVHEFANHHDAGIVHPGVKASEALQRRFRDPLDGLALGHVRHHVDGVRPAVAELSGESLQCLFVAGGEDKPGASGRGKPRGGQADAAGRAGDDDDLVAELLLAEFHESCGAGSGCEAPQKMIGATARSRGGGAAVARCRCAQVSTLARRAKWSSSPRFCGGSCGDW